MGPVLTAYDRRASDGCVPRTHVVVPWRINRVANTPSPMSGLTKRSSVSGWITSEPDCMLNP